MAKRRHQRKRKKGAARIPEPVAAQRPASTQLLAVATCFLLSGFAALLYQAAWLKKLGILFGTSHIAVATVLAAYMAGLALGAAVAGRYADSIKRPILVYGVLEAIIGISALLVPLFLELAQSLFVTVYGSQAEPVSAQAVGQTIFYLIATFAVLAVPTAAMGATLPLLSSYVVEEDRDIGPRVSLLYGINTVGAVVGVLVAAFLLLPRLGLTGTLIVGAVTNLGVFVIAALLARSADRRTHSAPGSSPDEQPGLHWVMPVMLLSGVVSFTLEVLWTRLLSHIFGGTVYAFAIMLACFLTGIALGSLAVGPLARSRRWAAQGFVIAQLAIAGFSWLSYTLIDLWIPSGTGLLPKALYAFAVIVPSTLFIGATYPLAVRVGAQSASQTPLIAGRIYAWNTVGAITGALLTGFIVLPAFGFGMTLKSAMIVSCALACLAAFLQVPRRMPAFVGAGLALLVAGIFVSPERPNRLIYSHVGGGQEWGQEYYYGVGRSATILMREVDGFINLSSNGLSESSVGRVGMPPFNLSQKWLSGLPSLARPDAESMLIIGYGGGVALEGVPPNIDDVDVIELEPEVIRANQSVTDLRGKDPLADPRFNLVLNDARNAITLTDKRYDIIVSQPSHPWTGGAAHLYTSEFLALSKAHLSEGGVFLQWINAQFVDVPLLKILMATLVDQFGYVELYQPERQVLLFLASDQPLDIWQGNLGAGVALRNHPRHYHRMGMRAVEDAIAMMSLDAPGVRAFARGAQVNTDDHNFLAFYSRANADGLTADTLLEAVADLDPLTQSQSEFRTEAWPSHAPHHIAERLLQANFIQRTFKMARATEEADVQATIDALGFDQSGDPARAESSFNVALVENPDNRAAQFGLLRLYLGAFAQADIPPAIAQLANRQVGPDRRVLEGWVFGAAGRFDRLASLDEELAAVEPTSLAFPIAVKLRVDWRVALSRGSDDPTLAKEGLTILDDLLASYWNLDLYILRSGCAYLAGDSHAFVESIGAAVGQVRNRLDYLQRQKSRLPDDEAQNLLRRLSALRQRLAEPIADPIRSRAEQIDDHLSEVMARL